MVPTCVPGCDAKIAAVTIDDAPVTDARARFGLLGGFLLALAAFFTLVAVMGAASTGQVAIAVTVLVIPAVLAAIAWRSKRWWVESRKRLLRTTVEASHAGLRAGGRLVLPRGRILAGLARDNPASL